MNRPRPKPRTKGPRADGGGGVSIGAKFDYNPCTNQRDPLDVAGRVNDLINCYLSQLIPWVATVLPQVILAVLLIVVMLIALYKIIKD